MDIKKILEDAGHELEQLGLNISNAIKGVISSFVEDNIDIIVDQITHPDNLDTDKLSEALENFAKQQIKKFLDK